MALTKSILYILAASVATGIAASQSGTAATKLTLNGSLVTAGVATLDSGGAARRVIVTSAGNDSTNSFTIVGTDRYGRPQTEVLTGANAGIAQTAHDFSTVTSITPTSNTASTVTAGTNGVGSSAPWIVDEWANPSQFGGYISSSGTAYLLEKSYDDLSPQWDVNTNTPTYTTAVDGTAGSSQDFDITTDCTMLRLTITSGTGTVAAKMRQSYAGRTT